MCLLDGWSHKGKIGAVWSVTTVGALTALAGATDIDTLYKPSGSTLRVDYFAAWPGMLTDASCHVGVENDWVASWRTIDEATVVT